MHSGSREISQMYITCKNSSLKSFIYYLFIIALFKVGVQTLFCLVRTQTLKYDKKDGGDKFVFFNIEMLERRRQVYSQKLKCKN